MKTDGPNFSNAKEAPRKNEMGGGGSKKIELAKQAGNQTYYSPPRVRSNVTEDWGVQSKWSKESKVDFAD